MKREPTNDGGHLVDVAGMIREIEGTVITQRRELRGFGVSFDLTPKQKNFVQELYYKFGSKVIVDQTNPVWGGNLTR